MPVHAYDCDCPGCKREPRLLPPVGRRRHRLTVDADTRRRIAARKIRARIDQERPAWVVGEVIDVTRLRNGDHRDAPLELDVTAVDLTPASSLSADDAHAVGEPNLPALACVLLDLEPRTHALVAQQELRASDLQVWVTRWSATNVEVPRLLAANPHTQGAYVQSGPVLAGAGEAPDEAWWEERHADVSMMVRQASELHAAEHAHGAADYQAKRSAGRKWQRDHLAILLAKNKTVHSTATKRRAIQKARRAA